VTVNHWVGGSIPPIPAKIGLLVQMARTPALHAGGREFESRTVHYATQSVDVMVMGFIPYEDTT
jgi:hypothetical protein